LSTYTRTKALEDETTKLSTASQSPFKALLPATQQAGNAFVRRRTKENGTLAKIAVVQWRIKHGTAPDSLADACREAGLESVPIDPYSDQPLRYRIIDGQPVVYAIGDNQIDDGGLIDGQDSSWTRGDMLFRVPEIRTPAGPNQATYPKNR
jgi:hypothetical protein